MADGEVSDEVRSHLTRLGVEVDALREPLEQHAGLQTLIGLVEASWTLEEAAVVLNCSVEEVAARAARRDLCAFPLGAELRLPCWQIVGGQPIPGLSALLAGLPEDLHPLSLARLMTTADATLGGLNPVEWLATAGAVAPVLARARCLASAQG